MESKKQSGFLEFSGKYGNAIVYAESVEDTATEQIKQMLDQPFAEGADAYHARPCRGRVCHRFHSKAD